MSGLHESFINFINIFQNSPSLWIAIILLAFEMFENIPDKINKLKRGASWLDIYLFTDSVSTTRVSNSQPKSNLGTYQ